mgnify:CR=1 FL=1
MILALLGTVGLSVASGWLFTTDRFWGVEWVEELHEGLATTVLVLAALHVAGVVVTSLRHREDLVGAEAVPRVDHERSGCAQRQQPLRLEDGIVAAFVEPAAGFLLHFPGLIPGLRVADADRRPAIPPPSLPACRGR